MEARAGGTLEEISPSKLEESKDNLGGSLPGFVQMKADHQDLQTVQGMTSWRPLYFCT